MSNPSDPTPALPLVLEIEAPLDCLADAYLGLVAREQHRRSGARAYTLEEVMAELEIKCDEL